MTTEIIAGRQPVLEALKSGKHIEKIFLLYGTKGSAIEKIRSLAKKSGVPVSEVNKQRIHEFAGDTATQGVVALIASKDYVDVEDLLTAARQKNEPPFLLILDEIEDPHNLGALIRTAECAGVHGVIVPKHHSASLNQTVAKTSAGASVFVPVAKVSNIAQTLDELKSQGVWIVGTDASAERLYHDISYEGPMALIVGNEGRGIRKLVKEKCDFLVKIPLYGKIDSLNASVAGALVLFEAARARHGKLSGEN